ncbi:MAG: MBOAT family protein [Clostridia bacterium]|nr:MBOAT family protein [Clostridia bacterium]
MNFNSLGFLLFLAVVLVLYFVLPHKVRWIMLLAASYYFYMSWNAWLVFLIAGTTVVSYGFALAMEKTKRKRLKKLFLALTIIICLGVLVFFKYFDFLCASVVDFLNMLSLGLDGFALGLLLPVGISFYTFQTLSYVIDVYRGTVKAEIHFGYYALFVSFFPQLVAGPIERPGDLIPQLKKKHDFSSEDMTAGFKMALCGFFRKCVVADMCGIYVDRVFASLQTASSASIYLGAVLFCVQMYCDFAGYSEIALGVARMMGIKLTENFDRPYLAKSYTEFFRRWHITLNKWFTDYLYIPLGGNRKGKARKIFNTIIVFALCGLWHGANWTYVLWGLYAAFFVCMESLLSAPLKKLDARFKDNALVTLLRRAFMFCIVFVPAAIIFRSPDTASLGTAFARLVTAFGSLTDAFKFMELDGLGFIQIAASIVCMVFIYDFARSKQTMPKVKTSKTYERTVYSENIATMFYCVMAIALFWLAFIATRDSSAFAYFQF